MAKAVNDNRFRILTIPGLYGSGVSHWQTKWEQLYGFERVFQDNWDDPQFDKWFVRLIDSIHNDVLHRDVLLVAHSMGCHLVIKSLPFIKNRVNGLFLVAPPELHNRIIKQDVSSFITDSINRTDIPGYLIYSENDPYAEPHWSKNLGVQLGIKNISVGMKGHINSESNLGCWQQGKLILNKLVAFVKANPK